MYQILNPKIQLAPHPIKHKNYGDNIDKSELFSYQMKKMGQMWKVMDNAMEEMEAGNLRSTAKKMEAGLGNDVSTKMIKFVLKLAGIIQILFCIFIWILHIIYIASDSPKNEFEKVWSIINIVIPSLWICCFICCWLQAKMMMRKFNEKW